MFLGCSQNHPNKELRKHLLRVPLSGQCHYMLISSFITKENTQLVYWQGHQSTNPAILHSLEMDPSLKKLLWLSPNLAEKSSFPWSASLKWHVSVPVDVSSVRTCLVLLCEDFMQFSHVWWCVWAKCPAILEVVGLLMHLLNKVFRVCGALGMTL